MRMLSAFWLVLITVPAWAAEKPPSAADWPQWLGPERNGTSPQKGIPNSFPAEGLKLLWKSEKFGNAPAAVGHGQNASPVVAFDKVFCHGNPDGNYKREMLYCFSLTDGKTLWSYQIAKVGKGNVTPVIDLESGWLYTSSDTSGTDMDAQTTVACLDAKTGQKIWTAQLGKKGAGSPLLYNNLLIVPAGYCYGVPGTTKDLVVRDPALHVFDKKTGKTLWTWPEKEFQKIDPVSYRDARFDEWYAKLDKTSIWGGFSDASPIVLRVAGRDVILQSVRGYANTSYDNSAAAVDPQTGKQVRFYFGFNSFMTPLFLDGVLATVQFEDSPKSYGTPFQNKAFRPRWEKDVLVMDPCAWKMEGGANRRTFASPTGANGHVFMPGYGGVRAYEVATGKLAWHNKDCYWCDGPYTSPLYADGKVLILNPPVPFTKNEGILYIIDAANGKTIHKQNLCGATGSNPAIASGKLIVRDYEHGIYCYELVPAAKK